MLTCEVIKAIRTDSILAAALGFVWCVCIVRVQVWSVLSLYCTGGDHHKAQTGGAIWSSLKPSPGILKWRWGGLGPLYDGCLREVDRAQPQWADPLMVPHTEEMDERPLITLTKTHSCIHIDKYTLRSHI